MTAYVFKVEVRFGVIEVRISASGYFAAEGAVRAMHPGGRVLTWHTE